MQSNNIYLATDLIPEYLICPDNVIKYLMTVHPVPMFELDAKEFYGAALPDYIRNGLFIHEYYFDKTFSEILYTSIKRRYTKVDFPVGAWYSFVYLCCLFDGKKCTREDIAQSVSKYWKIMPRKQMEYPVSISYALQWLSREESMIDNHEVFLKLLDIYIEALKVDLQVEWFLEHGFDSKLREPNECIPRFDIATNHKHTINFSDTTIVSMPYNAEKLANAVKDLDTSRFDEEKANYEVTYISGIDVGIVTNGFHHLAVAGFKKEGKIIAKEYVPFAENIDKIDFVYNGEAYSIMIDGKNAGKIPDDRLALLMAIYQLREQKRHLLQTT